MAYVCLYEFHWAPSYFLNLSKRDKAAVVACIDIHAEEMKKLRKK